MSELRIKNRSESDLHIILSYNGYKLNSQLTCSRGGFIAQSVEHCTGITEVMGLNPVEASEFFSGLCLYLLKLLHNCEDHFLFCMIMFHSSFYLMNKTTASILLSLFSLKEQELAKLVCRVSRL